MKGPGRQRFAAVGFGFLVAGMVALLAVAVWRLPAESQGLADEVGASLDRAGVTNPVTAVLLNFRAYDTLLEIAVLLLAVLGAQVLAGSDTDLGDPNVPVHVPADQPVNPVLLGFVRVIAPVMVVVAGYMLWVGGHAPGGAFQAGAVLAALGILLLLAGVQGGKERVSASCERWILVAGLVVFLAVGIGMMVAQRRFLEYPVAGAKWFVLLIEAFATFSIAAILIALFRGGRLVPSARRSSSRVERNP